MRWWLIKEWDNEQGADGGRKKLAGRERGSIEERWSCRRAAGWIQGLCVSALCVWAREGVCSEHYCSTEARSSWYLERVCTQIFHTDLTLILTGLNWLGNAGQHIRGGEKKKLKRSMWRIFYIYYFSLVSALVSLAFSVQEIFNKLHSLRLLEALILLSRR